MEVTIESVREQLNKELENEEAAWKIARTALTNITQSRAGVRHRIEVFEAQIKRAQAAALGSKQQELDV